MSDLFSDWTEYNSAYQEMLEEYVDALEAVSSIKDNIINTLQVQMDQKEMVILRQQQVIRDAEEANGMFVSLLSQLKETQNKKEYNGVLDQFNVDVKLLPYFN
jgi:hypothetical protein